MRGKRADTRKARYQVGERRSCSPPRTAMVPRGSESSLMRCGRSITAESGYQLLMLDSPSTGAEDPVVFNAVCLRTALQLTLVFQKRYLLDHLRLQIVGGVTARSGSGVE